jgi:uncharacterized protein
MALSIKGTIDCNLNCKYCYEHELRKTQNRTTWDISKIKQILKKLYEEKKEAPTLHGGEPLVMGKKDVEELLKFGYNLAGRVGMQTNGLLIDDDYIDMFKKYNVHVGISIDGPWPLNKARTNKENTEQIIKNIYKMVAKDVTPGIIVVLHRANGLPEHREQLKEFILEMKSIGINGGRLNLAEIDREEVKEELELSPEEAAELYEDLAKFVLVENDNLRWQPFRDVVDNLLGLGTGTCVFGKCDYFQADAERVINGDGSISTCYKNANEGITYEKDNNSRKTERYELLKSVPMEYGGCKECKYWPICYGGCPAEGAQNGIQDWRFRSRHCTAYRALYSTVEKHIKRLLPNTELIINRNKVSDDDYQIRSGNSLKPPALHKMIVDYVRNPSSWRGVQGCKNKQKSNNKKDCKSNNGKNRANNTKHGDKAHGDHSDHGDSY